MPDEVPAPSELTRIQAALLAWYTRHGRDLPWRTTRDPYAILVAEVMLQQTGVERVLPKYAEFLERFPTLEALAAAPRSEVIRRWAPLGYNLRAVRLHEIAIAAVREYEGHLPADRAALRGLKGIGEYTAGAIACFAFGDQRAFLDTNIRRVLGRIFAGDKLPRTAAGERAMRAIAEAALPPGRAYDWHQALMDLGATICRAAAPTCLICPVRDWCHYAAGKRREQADRQAGREPDRRHQDQPVRRGQAAGAFVGSTRYYRGRVVDYLRQADEAGREVDRIGAAIKPDYAPRDRDWLAQLLARLEQDGLVRRVAEDQAAYTLSDGRAESDQRTASDER